MWENPWTYILAILLIIGVGTVGVSLLSSLLITLAAGRYSDKVRKDHYARVAPLLPQKNCGECGCATCREYAQAAVRKEIPAEACPYAQPALIQAVQDCVNEWKKIVDDPKPAAPKRARWKKRI